MCERTSDVRAVVAAISAVLLVVSLFLAWSSGLRRARGFRPVGWATGVGVADGAGSGSGRATLPSCRLGEPEDADLYLVIVATGR